MEDQKRKIWIIRNLLLLSIGCCFVSQLHASSEVGFYESFHEPFQGRWTVSHKGDYQGVWKHVKSKGHNDYGLLVSEMARKYAIARKLDQPFELKERTFVLQYEVRFQNGLHCGGAYIKFLRPQNTGWTVNEFDNTSPYSIMFGPDKCGMTDKVHFIVNHKNPKTGQYVEHHLRYPIAVPPDTLTHVYTTIVKPNHMVRILVDGKEKIKTNLMDDEDFDPPLVPPKTIPDPDDKKPEDWDDRAEIPNPNAKKPDDWDEDAPFEIEDEEAEKPVGWLDDEPEEIDDPDAMKPDDWDDEEDGEWEAPKIDNPKCAEAPGCGEWRKPMKANPYYKGKWTSPMIRNPNYKGEWEPRKIDNPNYYKLDKPNLEPIAAIGIEIWTMQDGILFDNILITSSEKVASSYRQAGWKPKFDVEKAIQKLDESNDSGWLKGVQKMVFENLYKVADLPILGEHRDKVMDLIDRAEEQPNLVIGILTSIIVVTLTVFMKLVFGGGKKKPAKVALETAKTDTGGTSNDERSSKEKEEEKESSGGSPRRRNNTKRVH